MESFLKDLSRPLRFGIRRITASLRSRPDYIIPGAQKAGTSSLHYYLARHPDVRPSRIKEVHYFDLNYNRSSQWYRSFFPFRFRLGDGREGHRRRLTGEATPYYLYHPRVPGRMADLLPEIRLIVLLRDPVDRAISHYRYESKKGREHRSIQEALDPGTARLRHEEEALRSETIDHSFVHQRYSYLERGLYARQLRRYFNHFDREQIRIVESERFFERTAAVYEEVLTFLGLSVDRNRFPRFDRYNVTRYEKPPDTITRTLADYFKPHNEALFELLGRRFDWR